MNERSQLNEREQEENDDEEEEEEIKKERWKMEEHIFSLSNCNNILIFFFCSFLLLNSIYPFHFNLNVLIKMRENKIKQIVKYWKRKMKYNNINNNKK